MKSKRSPQPTPTKEDHSHDYSVPDRLLLMNHFQTPRFKSGDLYATPETEALTPATPFSALHLQQGEDDGYLGDPEEYRSRTLFRDDYPNQSDSSSSRSSSRRSKRTSQKLPEYPCSSGVSRRSSKSSRTQSSQKSLDVIPAASSLDSISPDSSPDRVLLMRKKSRSESPAHQDENRTKRCKIGHQNSLIILLGIVVAFSLIMIMWSPMEDEMLWLQHHHRGYYPPRQGPQAAGLRGQLVQMAGRGRYETGSLRHDEQLSADKVIPGKTKKDHHSKSTKSRSKEKRRKSQKITAALKFIRPPKLSLKSSSFEAHDPAMYNLKKANGNAPRIFSVDVLQAPPQGRTLSLYPAEFTDNTQYYGLYDSDDTRLSHMEIRQPIEQGECVPMKEWQTTYHPSCNIMHELGMEHMGETKHDKRFSLFGTKGYWRNAWKVEALSYGISMKERETLVLKTLKFQHSFEDAHFEHDRVDAVAMERLTASPHVMNVFGFCGHSVMTEFADGSRVGELADKARKKPLARLKIARDIANGLADVHGIDGDGNATFVHLDINPANVVSIGGTLKLNDFNIGIMLRWNTTSNTQCGFPAQYPNPQWRSPEEARNEQNLTEKVDIFSMGHIFFRLICGHEPWNKLELAGKPSKEEINAKVQKGILPRIPEDVMLSNDKEVAAIRDAMLACYAFDPKKRPSARKIAATLQEALEALEKELAETGMLARMA